jgi:hypothetical protein
VTSRWRYGRRVNDATGPAQIEKDPDGALVVLGRDAQAEPT